MWPLKPCQIAAVVSGVQRMVTLGFICFKSNAVCFSVNMVHVSISLSHFFKWNWIMNTILLIILYKNSMHIILARILLYVLYNCMMVEWVVPITHNPVSHIALHFCYALSLFFSLTIYTNDIWNLSTVFTIEYLMMMLCFNHKLFFNLIFLKLNRAEVEL